MIPVSHEAQVKSEILEVVTHPGWERIKGGLITLQQTLLVNVSTQAKSGTLEEIRFAAGKYEAVCDVLRQFSEWEQNAARR